MPVITKTPLKNQVYSIIKDRIMSSEYKLGEKINISNLSNELKISSTPIRDALSLLEKERLIINEQFTGPQVIQLNRTIFKETFDSVLILLLGAYEFCIFEDRIPQLVSLLSESIEIQKSVLNSNNRDFAEATIQVDTALMSACNNPHLFSIFSGTFSLQTLLLIHDYETRDYDREQNIREHEMFLNLTAAGKYVEARDLIRHHYNRSILFKH